MLEQRLELEKTQKITFPLSRSSSLHKDMLHCIPRDELPGRKFVCIAKMEENIQLNLRSLAVQAKSHYTNAANFLYIICSPVYKNFET